MVFRVAHYPASGKVAELRALLEEKEIGNYRSRGLSCNFMSRILPEDGPEFATYVAISSMEEWEKFRETNAADPIWRNVCLSKSR